MTAFSLPFDFQFTKSPDCRRFGEIKCFENGLISLENLLALRAVHAEEPSRFAGKKCLATVLIRHWEINRETDRGETPDFIIIIRALLLVTMK